MGNRGGGVENVKAEEGNKSRDCLTHGGLVDGELRVVDGTVVVDLAPASVAEAEDACGAHGEIKGSACSRKSARLWPTA
jgi:hypothetical protein